MFFLVFGFGALTQIKIQRCSNPHKQDGQQSKNKAIQKRIHNLILLPALELMQNVKIQSSNEIQKTNVKSFGIWALTFI